MSRSKYAARLFGAGFAVSFLAAALAELVLEGGPF